MSSSLYLVTCSWLSVYLATASDCRFAKTYKISDVLSNEAIREQFIEEYFLWENNFTQPGIGFDANTHMTFDGCNLNTGTGTKMKNRANSAASKESIHLMFIAHSLNDSNFKNIENQISILNAKLQKYDEFNKYFPGFGGYIPWYHLVNNQITPSSSNPYNTPALDNGEMYWSLYGLKWCILSNYQTIVDNNPDININITLNLLQKQMLLMEQNAKIMFYDTAGKIRWVTNIKDAQLSPTDPQQSYTGGSRAGDPFEGELFQWLLDLNSVWKNNENDEIWSAALNNLHVVNYTFKDDKGVFVNITVQRGWHFSSHEQWKLLELPYLDSNLMHVIFENVEKVRTLNSVYGTNGNEGAIAGMYASVNIPFADYAHTKGYDGNCGIPQIATGSASTYEFDVITPYSAMTLFLFNKTIGSVWLLNMLQATSMQNMYGSTESIYVNGTEICPITSWDSKITTYNGAKGGIADWTRIGLKNQGFYDRFVNVMEQQYSKIFGNDVNALATKYGFGIPSITVPKTSLKDFTTCS